MKGLTRTLGMFLLSFMSIGPAFAWSGPGHAAIAAMAYQQLSPEQQTRFTDILRSHPDFTKWQKDFNKKKPGFPSKLDLGTYLFIRASTWPDEIRGTGNPFDHPHWHFVDYPIQQTGFSAGATEPEPNDDVLFGIQESRRVLQDQQATAKAKAAHLSWLIHLVGDIQQPLHCASLFNGTTYRPPDGDRGGNLFFISVPHNPNADNLHSFWDGQLGKTKPPDPRTAFDDAVQLQSEHPRTGLPQLGTATDAKAWSLESRDAAVRHAYQYDKTSHGQTSLAPVPGSANDRKAPPLPSSYGPQVKPVARERIALGGYRLADTLKALTP